MARDGIHRRVRLPRRVHVAISQFFAGGAWLGFHPRKVAVRVRERVSLSATPRSSHTHPSYARAAGVSRDEGART